MSAFICGPDHFIALAVFATGGREMRVNPKYQEGIRKDLTRMEAANLYANILYAANIRSVVDRYPNESVDTLPGPCEKPDEITVSPKHTNHVNWVLKSVEILKLCDCLEYQSCEPEDYRTTTAFLLLDSIRGAAIRTLPGYEDAPWDYYPKPKAA